MKHGSGIKRLRSAFAFSNIGILYKPLTRNIPYRQLKSHGLYEL